MADASSALQLQREIRRVFKNVAFHVSEPSAALTRIARKIERHEYSDASTFAQEMEAHVAGGSLQRQLEEQVQQMAPLAVVDGDLAGLVSSLLSTLTASGPPPEVANQVVQPDGVIVNQVAPPAAAPPTPVQV